MTRERNPHDAPDADVCLIRGCDQTVVIDKYGLGLWCDEHDANSEQDARDDAAQARQDCRDER